MANPKPKGADPDKDKDTTTPDDEVVTPDDSATYIDSGDTIVDTVDVDHSTGAKDYPEPQSAKGAFVNDAGIDLNEQGDHTSTAQGNRYPFNKDAAAKFRDETDAKIRDLEREIDRLKAERDEWDKVANDDGEG